MPPRETYLSSEHVTVSTLSFHIESRWHPAQSLLGRFMARRITDPLRAEATYFLFLAAALVCWMLAQVLAWVLIGDAVAQDPGGTAAVLFWTTQLATAGLLVGVGLVGFTPPTHVRLRQTRLTIHQGNLAVHVDRAEVRRWRVVSARTMHRHYRLYRQARLFPGPANRPLLLLDTASGPVCLGLATGERETLVRAWGLPGTNRAHRAPAMPELAA